MSQNTRDENLTFNIAVDFVMGFLFGIAIKHIPLGISLGMLLGVGIGSLPWSQKSADDDD